MPDGTGWGEFAMALVLFMMSHAVPVRPPVRPWLVARLGLRGYFAVYSLLSVLVLGWLIVAAGRAPYVEVIPPWPVLRWVPLLVMPLVCVFAVAGLIASNPLSFGGMGRRPFDAAAPGGLAVTRHPLLVALLLWSVAHILANGDLAHVILFGLFALFAGAGMALVDRRKRRELGAEAWKTLAANTSRFSVTALGRVRPDARVLLAAAVLYAALLALHEPVIGMPPLP